MIYTIQNFETKELIKDINKFSDTRLCNVNRLKTKIFFNQYDVNKYCKKHSYNMPNYYIKVMYNKDMETLK